MERGIKEVKRKNNEKPRTGSKEKVIKYEKNFALKRFSEKEKKRENCWADELVSLDLLCKRTSFLQR